MIPTIKNQARTRQPIITPASTGLNANSTPSTPGLAHVAYPHNRQKSQIAAIPPGKVRT
jgi:hypothetical protein